MSLAQHLWDINADLAARIRTHDFVQGLGNGSLPIDNFKRYVKMFEVVMQACAGVRRPGAAGSARPSRP